MNTHLSGLAEGGFGAAGCRYSHGDWCEYENTYPECDAGLERFVSRQNGRPPHSECAKSSVPLSSARFQSVLYAEALWSM